MLNASYYRKQAEICTRLAKAVGSGESATRFKVLALEMLLRAEDAADEHAEVAAAAAPVGHDNLPAAHGNHDP
jgi:hypothetical protein